MKTVAYGVEKIGDAEALIAPTSRRLLAEVDAVVFDCDGVLIDARRSYDVAIVRTTAAMVRGFVGVDLPIKSVADELILRIRRTGGFNDDWDTTYALTFFSVIALEAAAKKNHDRKLSSGQTKNALRQLKTIVSDFSSENRLAGRSSVDEYLKSQFLDFGDAKELREYLDYPVNAVRKRMTATFDEMYYGGALFHRIFGMEPSVWKQKGLIDRERILMTGAKLASLERVIGGKRRMAISTGRPFVAVQYTLGPLLSYFDNDASVFMGDDGINPGLAEQLRKYKKPSGASLTRAYEKLSSKVLLYAGDSAEDRLMVEDARRQYDRILFAGIYGSSSNQREQVSYFTKNESDLVVESVNLVPGTLEMVKKR